MPVLETRPHHSEGLTRGAGEAQVRAVLPLSGESTEAGTTPSVVFRAVVRANGEVKMDIAAVKLATKIARKRRRMERTSAFGLAFTVPEHLASWAFCYRACFS